MCFIFSLVFSPNWGDSILVDLGKKHLNPTSFSLYFLLQPNTPISHFLSSFFHPSYNPPNQTNPKGLNSFSLLKSCTHFFFFFSFSNSFCVWHQSDIVFVLLKSFYYLTKPMITLSPTRNHSSPSSNPTTTPKFHNPPKPNHNSRNRPKPKPTKITIVGQYPT